jgi:O-antigen/teichoic acid export membrane protein
MAKFFIGALLTLAAVTYYATPLEAVTGFFIVPIALVQVMFPAFTASLKSDPQQTLKIYNGAFKFLFLIIFPIIFSIITFGPEALGLWLGPDFATTSGPVLRWLALGVFVASTGFLPGALILARGRPDLLAKLQLIIFPIFIIVLFESTKHYGIQGAAIAFAGQSFISAMASFFLAKRIYLPLGRLSPKPIYFLTIGVFCFYAIVSFNGLIIRSMIWLTVLLFFYISMWKLALKPEDREMLAKRIQWSTNP